MSLKTFLLINAQCVMSRVVNLRLDKSGRAGPFRPANLSGLGRAGPFRLQNSAGRAVFLQQYSATIICNKNHQFPIVEAWFTVLENRIVAFLCLFSLSKSKKR